MQALVQKFSAQRYEAQMVMLHVRSTVWRGGFLETDPAGIRDPMGLGSNIAKQCWMITFTQTAQKWGKSPGVLRPLAKQLRPSQRRGILQPTSHCHSRMTACGPRTAVWSSHEQRLNVCSVCMGLVWLCAGAVLHPSEGGGWAGLAARGWKTDPWKRSKWAPPWLGIQIAHTNPETT